MQIKTLAEQEKLPYLFFDSGGLLFEQTTPRPGLEQQDSRKARGIAAAMQAMNCRAAGISAHDLAGGAALLKKLQEEEKLTWLSMNLVDAASRQPIFASSLTVEIAGVSIAVLGLTDEQADASVRTENPGFVILPWKEVLPQAIAQAAGKADMIILLSSYSDAANKEIAQQFAAVNLILASGPSASSGYPFIVNDTLFAQTGARGKYLGMMRINWTKAKKWEDDLAKMGMEQDRLDRISQQLDRLRKPSGTADLSQDKEYQNLLAMQQEISQHISKLQEQKNSGNKDRCRFDNRFVSLESSLPEDPKIREIINKTTQDINDLNAARATVLQTGLAGPLKALTGWQQCGKCHFEQAAAWQQTRHAAAWQDLTAKNQQFNADCALCHVTLPYYDAGRVKAEKLLQNVPESLQSVGCESCHGPGKEHIGNPQAVHLRKPDEQTCKACHVPEHDSNFVFAEKVKKVSCPKRHP